MPVRYVAEAMGYDITFERQITGLSANDRGEIVVDTTTSEQ